MIAKDNAVGVILAGGSSRRMGRDKALLEFQGLPLIEWVSQTLRHTFEDVVVISDRRSDYDFLRLAVYQDIYKKCGPIGGIHSAFRNTQAQWLFVVGCDMPFISKELIHYLYNFESPAPIKVPEMDGRIHPTCGAYSRAVIPQIEKNLESGNFRLKSLFESTRVEIIPITSDLPFYNKKLLLNINNSTDLEEFEMRLPESH